MVASSVPEIQHNDLATQIVQYLRKQFHRTAMRIVNDELKFPLAHNIVINRFVIPFEIMIDDIGIAQDINGTYLIKVDTAEVFAEEEVLDLSLSRLVNIQAVLVEDLNLNSTLVKGRDADMDTTNGIGCPNKVACNRQRNLIDIMHIDTRRRQACVDPTFNHPRRAIDIPVQAND